MAPRWLPIRRLRRYLRDCRALRRHLVQFLSDSAYAKLREGTIYYAVDFSEIYSYVYPASQAKHVRLFSDASNTQLLATNEYVLSQLFFQRDVVLMAPYQVELDALLSSVSNVAVAGITDDSNATEST